MKKLLFWLLVGCIAQAHQIEMLKVAELNPTEAYAPQVFHQGHLWLGKLDYSSGKNKYHLEVRTGDGERVVNSHPVKHSLEHLYVFDENHILATGKSYTEAGWVTYYSLASLNKGKIQLETHALPSQFMVQEFAGGPERLFFNETGDRSVVQLDASGAQLLPLVISGPGAMNVIGNSLFVLERRSFKLGDEDIVKVDLQTMKVKRVFNDERAGIVSMLPLKGRETLAATEVLGQRILFIDTRDNRLEEVIPLKGTHPRTLAQWGNCLVVGSEAPLRLTVIDINHPKNRPVAQFDLEKYSSDLPSIRNLSVNPETASLFLRSTGFVDESPSAKNSVYRFSHSSWLPACDDHSGNTLSHRNQKTK
jgi:hypothetical protein